MQRLTVTTGLNLSQGLVGDAESHQKNDPGSSLRRRRDRRWRHFSGRPRENKKRFRSCPENRNQSDVFSVKTKNPEKTESFFFVSLRKTFLLKQIQNGGRPYLSFLSFLPVIVQRLVSQEAWGGKDSEIRLEGRSVGQPGSNTERGFNLPPSRNSPYLKTTPLSGNNAGFVRYLLEKWVRKCRRAIRSGAFIESSQEYLLNGPQRWITTFFTSHPDFATAILATPGPGGSA